MVKFFLVDCNYRLPPCFAQRIPPFKVECRRRLPPTSYSCLEQGSWVSRCLPKQQTGGSSGSGCWDFCTHVRLVSYPLGRICNNAVGPGWPNFVNSATGRAQEQSRIWESASLGKVLLVTKSHFVQMQPTCATPGRCWRDFPTVTLQPRRWVENLLFPVPEK